jgi:hypothetical protein
MTKNLKHLKLVLSVNRANDGTYSVWKQVFRKSDSLCIEMGFAGEGMTYNDAHALKRFIAESYC